MKDRFLITVGTAFRKSENLFRAIAENEFNLEDLANQLAYNNFISYGFDNEIAIDNGYDPSEMTESDWDELWDFVDESEYYYYSIELFSGTNEEWNEIGGEIYEI